jgi:hypothetical protein
LRIIHAILAGEHDPRALACLRNYRCHSSTETIEKALTGNYRAEHLFALEQALALYDAYHEKVLACDIRIEAVLKELSIGRGHNCEALPSSRRRTDQINGLAFDVRLALFALLGKDITRVDGFGPHLALKLIAECGDDLLAWPSTKHFTSWLGLRRTTRSPAAGCFRHERNAQVAASQRSCGLLLSPVDGPTLSSALSTEGSRRASASPRL